MNILTQCDHIDCEMPRRGRARIAGSAIAARFPRFADCPPSAGVHATVVRDFRARAFAAIDIGKVDDRRTISRDQARATK
jgi:hypothetical protein